MSHKAAKKVMSKLRGSFIKRPCDSPEPSGVDSAKSDTSENVVTEQSDFQHINTNYMSSSESVAATQFTQDDEKFAKDDHRSFACERIRSVHVPREGALHYMRATNPLQASGEDLQGIRRSLSPSHDAFHRPNWRAAAAQTNRAGNVYDYTRSEQHLTDRLFFQQDMMPEDLALLAACHQALQDSRAAFLENRSLSESLEHKEKALQELEEHVSIAQERHAQLCASNDAMKRAISQKDETFVKDFVSK